MQVKAYVWAARLSCSVLSSSKGELPLPAPLSSIGQLARRQKFLWLAAMPKAIASKDGHLARDLQAAQSVKTRAPADMVS